MSDGDIREKPRSEPASGKAVDGKPVAPKAPQENIASEHQQDEYLRRAKDYTLGNRVERTESDLVNPNLHHGSRVAAVASSSLFSTAVSETTSETTPDHTRPDITTSDDRALGALASAADPVRADDRPPVRDETATIVHNTDSGLENQSSPVSPRSALPDFGQTVAVEATPVFVEAPALVPSAGLSAFVPDAAATDGSPAARMVAMSSGLSLSSHSVDENSPGGTVIAVLSTGDAGSENFRYEIAEDASGNFMIVGNQLLLRPGANVDYETIHSYNLSIKVTNPSGQSVINPVSIDVNDLNDSGPTNFQVASNAVTEAAASGSVVAVLSATDADVGDHLSYSIANDPSGLFEIVGNEVRIRSGAHLDYETAPDRTLTVRVMDSGGNFADQSFTVNVSDVNEFAVTAATDTNAAANTVAENAATGTTVGITAHAVDADGTTNAVSYSLVGGSGEFAVDATTGVVTVAGGIDYEAGATRTITVRATSADGSHADQSFTVNVSDVNEFAVTAATDTNAAANTVAENAAVGSTVGITAHAVDADGTTNAVSYSLVSPSGEFAVDATTGVVTVAGGIDYEAGATRTITVRATSADGSHADQSFTVNVSDVNEFAVTAATDTNAAANVVAENAAVGSTVGITAHAVDADGTTNAVSYSLVGGSGEFAVDATTGVVTVAGGIDYEAGATRTITVRATSADGSHADQSFTVNVSDVNEFAVTAATDTNAAANTVAENASVGSTVGITAHAVDADGTTNAVSYSLVGGSGEFAVDATTGVVTVAGGIDYEAGATRTITVRATSADGSHADQSFTVNVSDVNEFAVTAATDTNAAANTVAENASVGSTVGITAHAVDADGTTNAVSYSLVGGSGEFAVDATTGVVTVAGGIDYEAGATRTITVRATSADGSTADQSFTVNVSDVNEFAVTAATDTNAAANTVAENASVGSTVGITAHASDADGTTNAVSYSLVGGTGEFAVDATTGVVTVAGGIDYEAGATRTITVRATSADGSHADQSFTVNVSDVNEFAVTAATDTNAAANTVAENAATGTTVGITAHAVDADGTTNAVSYSLVGGSGEFAVDATTGVVTVAGGIDYEAGATRTITVRATSADGSTADQSFTVNVSDVNEFAVTAATDTNAAANTVAENAAVGSTVGITAHAVDADGTTNAVSYSLVSPSGEFAVDATTGVVTVAGGIDYEAGATRTITVRATSADGSHADQSFTVNVSDVNEFAVTAATDTNAAANVVAENAAVGSTVGITAHAVDADGTTNAVSYSLVGGSGEFAVDATTGVVTVAGGIDYEAGATRTITVRATSADGSHADQSFTVNVSDVNEFAVTAATDTNAAANTVAENASVGSTVGITAHAVDADGTTNAVSYSLVGGSGEFAVDATTGVVTVAGGIDYEAGATRTITVRATSADGSTADQSFTVNVSDVNEFAVTAATDTNAAANTVAENASVGSTVGITAHAVDADGTTNAVSYSLVGGSGEFAVDATTGVVTVAGGIDYEAGATRTITVRATSADGSHADQSFTVNVSDVNEFAVTAATDTNAAANTVAENASVGSTVGITAHAVDADGTTNAVSYSLVGGSGEFAVDATTGVVTVAGGIDYEAGATRTITVRATSADGSHADQSFTVNVSDVNEFAVTAATDTNAAANTVAENASVGSTVGITAHAVDADGTTNAVSYSLVGGSGEFAVDATTGVVTVAGGIDYEAGATRTITVRATSADGSTADQSFTVNVSDVNEFAVTAATDTNAAANTVAENASVGSTVGITAHAVDADGTTNAVSYSLVGGSGEFAVDATTGVVTVAGGIDYEAGATRTITVRATSADGSHADQSFTVNVSDVNEFAVTAATDTNAAANTVAENASVGSTVGITAHAVDADGTTNAVSYSLVSPSGEFAVDATTGVVTVAGGIDYEAGATRTITVRATSADGSHADQSFTVNVSDVNEFAVTAATDTNAAANTVAENAATGTTVGITAHASDADGTTNAVSYSLVGGSGEFAVDATTGVVTVAGGIDYEAGATRTITVRATSADGSHADQSFTVNVSDVNEFAVTAATDTNAAANVVAENAAVGSTVGITAHAVDADGTTNAVSYSLVSPSGEFAVDATTGVVTVAGGIDYEAGATRTITVRATSADGSHADQSFTVNVSDVNEFAVTAATDTNAAANVVAENAAVGSTVGITAHAVDADGTTNAVSYSLVSPSGEFAVDATTGVVTVAGGIDYEAGATRTITVRATSADGSHADQSFTVNVSDVNEFAVTAATDTNAAANTVAENASVGSTVGITAHAVDADGTTNAVSYSLVGGSGEFAVDATTGVVTVAGGIDYEAGATRTITVRATSADGSTADQSFTVNVSDVNEFAVTAATDTNAAANTVAENASVGSTVGITAHAVDADGTTNAVSYSLVGGSGEFAVDATTGVVTVAGGIDYEAGATRTITVRATSADGSHADQSFTVNVSDVNEFAVTAATDTNAAANTVAENASVGSTVGITAHAVDADGTTNAVSYSLVGGSGEFAVDATTGVVTVAGGIDYEAGATRTITVRATSADGSHADQSFTVNVSDVNEFAVTAATDTNAAANTVAENASVGSTVGITAHAVDADGTTNAVSYSLVGGSGEFAVDATTGVVTVAGGIDYEAGATRTITVRATSADGSTADQSFTVNVSDVNEFAVTAATDTNAAANTVAENASVGSTVGITAHASDADGTTNAVSYSLVGGTGEFAVDATTGVVTVAGGIDYEAGATRTITVRATSADGSTADQSFTVNVTDQLGQTINGTAGADSINGTSEQDSIIAGAGNDTIFGSAGGDTIDGGADTDWVDYSASGAGVNVSFLTNTGSGGDAEGDVYIGVEGVVGSAYGDVLQGGTSGAKFYADGGAGADTIIGGSSSQDSARYFGSSSGVNVNLTTGQGHGGDAEGDVLSSIERLDGSTFADTLTGDANANTLYGNGGDDSLSGMDGNDVIYGYSQSGVYDPLRGVDGNDSIDGGAGNDTLYGQDGNDTLIGGAGNDYLDGGVGTDVAVFTGAATDYTIVLNDNGTVTVTDNRVGSPDGTDTLVNIETLRFSNGDFSIANGTASADVVGGTAGRDLQLGGSGDDTLTGSAGSDVLVGGAGTDTVDYSASASGVNIAMQATDSVGAGGTMQNVAAGGYSGDANGDTYSGIENVVGSAYADNVFGGAVSGSYNLGAGNDVFDTDSTSSSHNYSINAGDGNDSVYAGGGNDSVSGGLGNDYLSSEGGNDTLDGGAGNDTLDGGTGTDIAVFTGNAANYTFTLNADGTVTVVDTRVGSPDGTDTISNIETLRFADGDYTLNTGTTGADSITASGTRTIDLAGSGNDTVTGGSGIDIMQGDGNTDTLSYATDTAGVSVNLATNAVSGGNAAGDTISGFENVTGGSGNDSLTGSSTANSIDAGAGNDTVVATAGGDTLVGGSGTDTLSFGNATSGVTVNLATTTAQNTGTDFGNVTQSGFENVTTGSGNDSITGDTGANSIDAGAGNDTVVATAGGDTLVGGSGTDTLSFGNATSGVTVNLATTTAQNTGTDFGNVTQSGFENVTTGSGNDSITGDAGANSIDAGAGNDTVVATAGGDTLVGGSGTDTLSFGNATSGVTVNLATTTVQNTGTDFGNVTQSGFENVTTGSGNDSITGDTGANSIDAGAGNDTVVATAGGDTLVGGSGNDTLSFGNATSGVTVNLATTTAQNTGTDFGNVTQSGFENVTTGSGNDSITGDTGANSIMGGAGSDTITGGAGNDTLDGGTGSDIAVFTGNAANYTFTLNADGTVTVVDTRSGSPDGTDTISNIETLRFADGDYTLNTGTTGADSITASGARTIDLGGNGNDTVIGGSGIDIMQGDGNTDTLSYSTDTTGVTIDLTLNTASGGNASGDTISGFENIIGGSGADRLGGNSGANSISGGAGADTILASAGGDTLDGGSGTDTLDVSAYVTSGVSINMNTTAAQATGAYGNLTISNFENIYGSTYNDTFIGDGNANSIFGNAGDDTITGGAGNDTIVGGSGTDVAVFSGSAANYTFTLNADGTVTIVDTRSGSPDGTDIVSGIETLRFADGDYTLNTGTTGADSITASGTRTIDLAGSGNDTVTGGSGIDIMQGDGNTDTLSYATDTAGVSVNLATNAVSGGNAAGDTISGFENVTGGSGNDTITGDTGANSLVGGAGADSIIGGLGADTLSGGIGNDTLYAGTSTDHTDTDSSANYVDGGDGDDYIMGGLGADTLIGGLGNDTLFSKSGAGDSIDAGDGNDTIFANAASTIQGGTGTDTVYAYYTSSNGATGFNLNMNSSSVEVFSDLTGGNDTITAAGAASAVTVFAGAGNDSVTGSSNADWILGDSGADSISGGLGNDTIFAGTSADHTDTDTSANYADGGDGDDFIMGGLGSDTLLGGLGNDQLYSKAGAGDSIDGGDGNDTIFANAASTIQGGLGVDSVYAQYSSSNGATGFNLNMATSSVEYFEDLISGNDTITAAGAATAVTVNAAGGNDSVTGSSNNDWVMGGLGADTIVGGAGNDQIFGGTSITPGSETDTSGNSLDGGSGDDYVMGGSGADTLIGGSGNDTLTGGAGIDIAVFTGNAANYTFTLNADGTVTVVDTRSGSPDGTDTITGIETLRFADGDYTLNAGTSGNDSITASGARTIDLAGSGNDTVVGGTGADILRGDGGTDTLSYATDTTGVNVNLSTNTVSGGNAAGDTISGFENITGGSGNDSLTGDSGANSIDAGGGNDTVIATAGGDTLVGGSGTDTLDLSGAGAAVTLNLGTTTVQNTGTTYGNITQSGFETVIGSSYNDMLTGDANANSINAGSGNDTVVATAGGDTLVGGSGTDTLSFASATGGVSFNNATTIAQNTGAAIGTLTASGFESIVGSDYADTISVWGSGQSASGGLGNDTLAGDAGTTLDGGAGTDTFDGTWYSGNATLNMASGQFYDTASGSGPGYTSFTNIENANTGSGNDLITTNSGANSINAGAGNDTIVASAGGDTLVGGSGTDTIDLSGAGAAVTLNLATASAQNTGASYGNVTVSGIENITGSSYNDSLTGDGGANTILGGAGNDTIVGDSETNLLSNGSFEFGIANNAANFSQSGGSWTNSNGGGIEIWANGYNSQSASEGSNYLELDAGTTLDGVGQSVTTVAGQTYTVSFDMALRSGTAASSQDFQVYWAGQLIGQYVGASTSWSSVTFDVVGTGGSDRLEFRELSSENDMYGALLDNVKLVASGNDYLDGGTGNDSISGGGGNDTIIGGAGADTLSGGTGTDTLSYATDTTGVTVNLTANTASGGDAAGDVISGFENLTGGSGGDSLTGNTSANSIDGGAGNDTIVATTGGDTLVGGSGWDVLDMSGAGSAVTINLGTTTAQATGAYGTMTASGFEQVRTGSYNDSITASSSGSMIESGAGNDTVVGGSGNDTIDGGTGNDVLTGGAGIDTIAFWSATAGVNFNLATTTAQNTGGAGTDTVSGFENIIGSTFNDTLTGNSSTTSIDGGAGNDNITAASSSSNITLMGGAGNDTLNANGANGVVMIGGSGSDIFNGNGVNTTVDYSSSSAAVSINLTTNVFSGGDAAGDTLNSINTVIGSDYNDYIRLNTGGTDEVAYGGAGNDTMTGENGDILHGGDGSDTFDASWYGWNVAVNLATGQAYDLGSGTGAGWVTLNDFENAIGTAQNDSLTGSSGDNYISGLAGNDTINAGDGNDTVDGGAGTDIMTGGLGTDTVTYATATSAVTVNLSTTTAQNTGGGGTDTISGFENLTGSNYNDTLAGDSGSNYIDGGSGNDIISGNGYTSAADLLVNGEMETSVNGTSHSSVSTVSGWNVTGQVRTHASGSDGVTTTDGGDYMEVDASSGTDYLSQTVSTVAGQTYVLSFQMYNNTSANGTTNEVYWNNTLLSSFDQTANAWTTYTFTVTGTGGSDVLKFGDTGDELDADYLDHVSLTPTSVTLGGGSGDSLFGGAGNDTIYGTTGNDTIDGGSGNDSMVAGAGTDMLTYESATSAVTVNLSTTTAQVTGGAGTDTISGFENLTGSSFNDTLTGDSNANVIYGGAGNDSINAGAGNDTIYGGAGNDILVGGTGSDTFEYAMGDGNDTIYGGAAGGWTDTIDVGSGTISLGTYGTDWTVALTTGSISNADTVGHSLTLTNDAAGTITLSDGSTISFQEIERITW